MLPQRESGTVLMQEDKHHCTQHFDRMQMCLNTEQEILFFMSKNQKWHKMNQSSRRPPSSQRHIILTLSHKEVKEKSLKEPV